MKKFSFNPMRNRRINGAGTRPFFLLMCFLAFACVCFAQDIIVTRDSKKIEAKVTEISVDMVKYRHFNNLDGPLYSLPKSNIATIIFQNGLVETFDQATVPETPTRTVTTPARTQTTPPARSQTAATTTPVQRTQVATYSNNDKRYRYFPNMGYKGFIDIGISVGTKTSSDSYYVNDGENRVEFSTSHGVLINPYIFVGGGVGFHGYTGYYKNDSYYSYDDFYYTIPLFVHVRSHFLDRRVSPFADIKVGYSVSDNFDSDGGMYFATAIGCRFATGSRAGFSISLGYSLQQVGVYHNKKDMTVDADAFSLKLGWDF